MKWLKRKMRSWLAIEPANYPHRIITMINWHDTIIVVDGLGDIYEMRPDFSGVMITSLLMQNPLEK